MYQDIKDVVLAVKEKYNGVTLLSRGVNSEGESACFYGHTANGVGCAIGCLFAPEIAHSLDKSDDSANVVEIYGDSTRKPILDTIFGPEIKLDQLQWLQDCHDHSDTVTQFMERLDNYLEGKEEIPEDYVFLYKSGK